MVLKYLWDDNEEDTLFWTFQLFFENIFRIKSYYIVVLLTRTGTFHPFHYTYLYINPYTRTHTHTHIYIYIYIYIYAPNDLVP